MRSRSTQTPATGTSAVPSAETDEQYARRLQRQWDMEYQTELRQRRSQRLIALSNLFHDHGSAVNTVSVPYALEPLSLFGLCVSFRV